MKIKNRKKFACITSVIVVLITILAFGGWWTWKYYGYPDVPDTKDLREHGLALPDNTQYASLQERASFAEAFAKSHNLSTHYALFVDYNEPSGSPRLYVWDFHQKKIVARTYVMHGPGEGSTAEKAQFSNLPGSNCSSLGRFMVTRMHGNRNKSGFRLKGLDIDNQTAFVRGLMIHSSGWVDRNCWRKYIPLNAKSCMGCVTVSSRGLSYISKLVYSEQQPIMLWNYCSR